MGRTKKLTTAAGSFLFTCAMLGVGGLATGAARADVYDDVSAWWQFDYDANSNGMVDAIGEVRDQRHWGTAATPGAGHHATSLTGTPEWEATSFSAGPAGGQPYGGTALKLDPFVDGTNVTAQGFAVSNFSLAGSVTLVTRFKWDGYPASTQTAWLYYNDFNFADPHTTGGGFLFGLSGSNASPTLLYGNTNNIATSWTTTQGAWYDMAVVITDNGTSDSITMYRWQEGGAIESQTFNVDYINTNAFGNGTHVGYESAGTGSGSANQTKSFMGSIDDVAVWNRALSTAEVNEAFGDPQPIFKIGLDNGTNDDLRLESEANNSTYTIGDPWNEFARAVSTGVPSTNINFTLSAEEAALPQIFHMETQVPESGNNFNINVAVNGHDLGTYTVNAITDLKWLITPDKLNVGANVLTLSRAAGSAAAFMSWDWVELGGSWQLGLDNDSQSEFVTESGAPDDFYVTDPNLMHLERAIVPGDTTIHLHFALSDEMALEGYRYETEVISQNPGTGNPFDVFINGFLLQSFAGLADHTKIDLYINPNQLHAGDNVISIVWTGSPTSGPYTQFDYHQLTVIIPEPATMSMLALGLPLLMRRRRK